MTAPVKRPRRSTRRAPPVQIRPLPYHWLWRAASPRRLAAGAAIGTASYVASQTLARRRGSTDAAPPHPRTGWQKSAIDAATLSLLFAPEAMRMVDHGISAASTARTLRTINATPGIGPLAAAATRSLARSTPAVVIDRLITSRSIGRVAALSLPLLAARAAYNALDGGNRDGVKGAAIGFGDTLVAGRVSASVTGYRTDGWRGAVNNALFGVPNFVGLSAVGGHINDRARAQSAASTAPQATVAPRNPAARQSYVTVDGRTIEATEAQARAWGGRRTT